MGTRPIFGLIGMGKQSNTSTGTDSVDADEEANDADIEHEWQEAIANAGRSASVAEANELKYDDEHTSPSIGLPLSPPTPSQGLSRTPPPPSLESQSMAPKIDSSITLQV